MGNENKAENIEQFQLHEEKKKIKWKKVILIYVLVYILTGFLLAIIASQENTTASYPGNLNTALETYFIYKITEKDWSIWKKILLIIVSYLGVEIAISILVKALIPSYSN